MYEVGAVIAALDGQMLNQGSNFGHDGRSVICHTEAEELLWTLGPPEGEVVFWLNDYEAGHPEYSYLSSPGGLVHGPLHARAFSPYQGDGALQPPDARAPVGRRAGGQPQAGNRLGAL